MRALVIVDRAPGVEGPLPGGAAKPRRCTMAPIVLAASSPALANQRAILRPPQHGCAGRTASTASSTAAALRAGLVCGRRERSRKPTNPSARKRRSQR